MANIKLGDLYLPKEESKDIIELLAKKRNIKNYKSKSSDRLYNIFKKQSKIKKRIDNIREELKNPKYNISKSESKDIKRNLYNIEKQRKIMKKFSKDFREQVSKIINYEKKKMIPLTTEEKIYHNKQKICSICKKEFNNNEKKNYKVRDHCHYTGKYRGAAHNICNLRHKVSKEIPIVFHSGSIYDYHFIIKELVKEFQGNFECLDKNTEKYITFSVPIKKKIENKDLEIRHNIKFIDSYTSLSKLVDNLSEGVHNNKCSDCGSNLDYIKIKS